MAQSSRLFNLKSFKTYRRGHRDSKSSALPPELHRVVPDFDRFGFAISFVNTMLPQAHRPCAGPVVRPPVLLPLLPLPLTPPLPPPLPPLLPAPRVQKFAVIMMWGIYGGIFSSTVLVLCCLLVLLNLHPDIRKATRSLLVGPAGASTTSRIHPFCVSLHSSPHVRYPYYTILSLYLTTIKDLSRPYEDCIREHLAID